MHVSITLCPSYWYFISKIGVEQTFKGFTVELRYMRLYVVDNHGGNCICFQGIKLHGADCRISSFLTTCQKHHLVETFIAKVSKGAESVLFKLKSAEILWKSLIIYTHLAVLG